MVYRSLLVLLDQDDHHVARVRYAIKLAQSLDCHLVGLAPTGLLELPMLQGSSSALSELSHHAWQLMRQRTEEAVELFDRACAAAGFTSRESLVVEDGKATALIRHSHCCDLVIMSQPEPRTARYAEARAVLEEVVLASARPTLIVPYAGRFDPPRRKAMIAWDEGREAARAVADALPLLSRMEGAQLMTWRPSHRDHDPTLAARADAFSKWLLWHGVQAEVRTEVSDLPLADAMLSRAADLGVDLLVMGAYGHPRWAQRVLGGATRGILDAMTVPVLMSH
ncbi:MAG TPA: universal stress protein [Ideonella sp.]|uniref:universal stress protein n=1 Tax=Ideonella sp. TaxID=1929293 RepID=UPI002E3473A5|nr:universal stress protein [Ideonella sp.]HEX5685293.1 universal stress protein [Ideonella sp.]